MTSKTSKVEGSVEPRFAGVREAFERNFTERGEVGAALCVYVDGRAVVDLWGGTADAATGRPWAEDTICRMDSTTKAAAATCVHMLVDQGAISLDVPVAQYWPEFAGGGKGAITVRQLLAHTAGIPVLDRWLTLDDFEAWDPVIEAIEAQVPAWEPGTKHGYHAYTFGFAVSELVRRVTGVRVGEYLRKHVAEPLGLDLWIGTPEHELARIAPVIVSDMNVGDMAEEPGWIELTRQMMELPTLLEGVEDPLSVPGLTLPQRVALAEVGFDELNTPRALTIEIAAANGVATARSHARMYAAAIGEVDGVRLLSPEAATEAARRHAFGTDEIMLVRAAWGLGYTVPGGIYDMGEGANTFGHAGANGTMALADPDASMAFAYTRNGMSWSLKDPRGPSLLHAVYDCLGGGA